MTVGIFLLLMLKFDRPINFLMVGLAAFVYSYKVFVISMKIVLVNKTKIRTAKNKEILDFRRCFGH